MDNSFLTSKLKGMKHENSVKKNKPSSILFCGNCVRREFPSTSKSKYQIRNIRARLIALISLMACHTSQFNPYMHTDKITL